MRTEIPNLDDWAQIGEHGEKRLWNNYYFRWMPCITCEEWQAYIERILKIALTDGGFDGIMFDNAFVHPCYCGRCERKFTEHLAALPDPEGRFGFADVSGVRQPRPTDRTDSKDPVYQEWVRWRTGLMNAMMSRFRQKIKSVKGDAIVSANAQPFRASDIAAKFSLEMISFSDSLDLFLMQSDTFPGYDIKTGIVSSRVRDLKIASELGKPIVALCDGNAGQYDLDESEYMRPLVEDLIWKGIPTDRTVMSPVRTPGFIDRVRVERRKPMLAGLNALAERHREQISAPSYQPVRILYPAASLMFSKAAHCGVTAAEEILLRNHVPFGYAIARGTEAPELPSDCEVLVVANQEWLSDAQIVGIADFAKRGGRIVVTGESGLWDEHGQVGKACADTAVTGVVLGSLLNLANCSTKDIACGLYRTLHIALGNLQHLALGIADKVIYIDCAIVGLTLNLGRSTNQLTLDMLLSDNSGVELDICSSSDTLSELCKVVCTTHLLQLSLRFELVGYGEEVDWLLCHCQLVIKRC